MLHPRVRTVLLSIVVCIVLAAIVILLLKSRSTPLAVAPKQQHVLSISVAPDHRIAPGSSKILVYTIRNNGTAIETYNLTVTSTIFKDWINPADVPETVVVQPGQEARVPVMVTIPEKGYGYSYIILRAAPLSRAADAIQAEASVIVDAQAQ